MYTENKRKIKTFVKAIILLGLKTSKKYESISKIKFYPYPLLIES